MIPLPELAAPHWQAAAKGELSVPHCLSCGHRWFPPARRCPRCLGDELDWVAVSGRGRVAGQCQFHRAYFRDLDLPLPYTVLHVVLDDGPQLYANPVDPADLYRVGQAVEAVFVPRGEAAVVRFRALEEQ